MADIDTHESDETLDSGAQPDGPLLSEKEVLRRWRIGNLLTVQSIAVENAKVYKELRKERLEPSLASRLTQILINQKCIVEMAKAEQTIADLILQVEELKAIKGLAPRRAA